MDFDKLKSASKKKPRVPRKRAIEDESGAGPSHRGITASKVQKIMDNYEMDSPHRAIRYLEMAGEKEESEDDE